MGWCAGPLGRALRVEALLVVGGVLGCLGNLLGNHSHWVGCKVGHYMLHSGHFASVQPEALQDALYWRPMLRHEFAIESPHGPLRSRDGHF